MLTRLGAPLGKWLPISRAGRAGKRLLAALAAALLARRRAVVDFPIGTTIDRNQFLVTRVLDFAGLVGIDKTAQGKRQCSTLPRARQRLRLLRLQLQSRGLADNDLLSILFFNCLVDRENPHIAQIDVRTDTLAPVSIRILLTTGQQNIDTVVGQDIAARSGFRGDFCRNRTHAAW